MRGIIYLAWRHLLWHRWKTLILVGAITMVMYLPLGLPAIERLCNEISQQTFQSL
jgi:hypothetical protein